MVNETKLNFYHFLSCSCEAHIQKCLSLNQISQEQPAFVGASGFGSQSLIAKNVDFVMLLCEPYMSISQAWYKSTFNDFRAFLTMTIG